MCMLEHQRLPPRTFAACCFMASVSIFCIPPRLVSFDVSFASDTMGGIDAREAFADAGRALTLLSSFW
jgi:hypothetical protein